MKNRKLNLSAQDAAPVQVNSPFYTVSDLAKYLQLNPMTIYRLVKAGELPYYAVGRVMRFRRNEIEKFLQGVRVPSRGEFRQ